MTSANLNMPPWSSNARASLVHHSSRVAFCIDLQFQACGAGRASWKVSYAARVRFCGPCWRAKYVRFQSALFHHYLLTDACYEVSGLEVH